MKPKENEKWTININGIPRKVLVLTTPTAACHLYEVKILSTGLEISANLPMFLEK